MLNEYLTISELRSLTKAYRQVKIMEYLDHAQIPYINFKNGQIVVFKHNLPGYFPHTVSKKEVVEPNFQILNK